MKQQHIQLSYHILKEHELGEDDLRLVGAARQATQTSFSPYSHFRVGAALLLANGALITGSNQENAAFTTGICAERCAMFYANARYPDIPVVSMAIAARQPDGEFTEEPVSPCGACRQVLAETEHRFGQTYRLLLCGAEKIYIFDSAASLLPLQFTGEAL